MEGIIQFPAQPPPIPPRPKPEPALQEPPEPRPVPPLVMLPELPMPPDGGRDLPRPTARIPAENLGTGRVGLGAQKRVWPWVLLWVTVIMVLFVALVIYYGSLPE